MATLTVQRGSLTGATPSMQAADAAGDTFVNDGDTRLRVKNGSAAAITVAVPNLHKCSFGHDHPVSVSVPAGGERVIGPFPRDQFGSPVTATCSAVASVTVAAEG